MRTILIVSSIFSLFILNANAQDYVTLTHNWGRGSYYTNDGKKINGLISNEYIYTSYILFRASEDSSKVKVRFITLKSYVIGIDTFTINSKMKSFQVVLNRPIKMYLTYQRRGTGYGSTFSNYVKVYYYGPNADSLTQITRKEFKTVMNKIMADNPKVVSKINDKTYEFGDMEDLLTFYKTGAMPDHEEVETVTQ